MFSKEVTLSSASGLHARPASLLVKLCTPFSCRLSITGGRFPIDPKSIITVLSAAIQPGTVLTVTGEGEDAQQAVEAVCDFIASLKE